MKVAISHNPTKNQKDIISNLTECIIEAGFTIDNTSPDIVFAIGGDGTLLRAVHQYIDKLDSIKFVGIYNGSLGFLFDFDASNIPEVINSIKNNSVSSKSYKLLKAELSYSNSACENIYAINEIRLENPFHTLIADVEVDKEHLETFHGNGLVVSSPLGSAAYNKSLGGALVSPNLDAIQLTEIATIRNNFSSSLGSSVLVPGSSAIRISGDFNRAVVGYDHLNSEDKHPCSIEISLSNKSFTLIQSKDHHWIKSIKRSFIK